MKGLVFDMTDEKTTKKATKLKFEAIMEGRGSGAKPPRVNPDGCIIIGVDKAATELVRAHGGEEGAKVLAAYEHWYSNPEVTAFLADPRGFLADERWPEDVRMKVEGMLVGIARHGANLTPVTLRDFEGSEGDRYACVIDGRHTVACVRVLRSMLRGEVTTGTPVDALVRELRASRGADWKPDLYAVDAVVSAETGETMDDVELAAVKQVLRIPTRRERWDMVTPRFKAAVAAGKKPDLRGVAAIAGISAAEAASWFAIFKMDKAAVSAFLDGAMPASSIVQFATQGKAEQAASIAALIESGDTTVSAARTFARAARQGAPEEEPAAEDDESAALDGEPIEPAEGKKPAAKKAPKPADPATKPWTAKQLYDHATELGDRCPVELMAAAMLVYRGPSVMTKTALRSIKVSV